MGFGGAFTAAGFGAAGFAAIGAAFLGAAFLGAAFLTAFFAFALTFFFAFTGRVFLFAALFLAERLTELRLAFAIGRFDLRFFDLLFFAMIILLLKHRSNSRCESSPEKVCCHLCVSTGVADADCVG
ncbi:MAG TPA: hypothetical protein VN938_06130 [Xanthobacteraceae bacterium]|nr:hypothetical protein [Xanthobacteraceae bacterium]